jgi:hypothetical protein
MAGQINLETRSMARFLLIVLLIGGIAGCGSSGGSSGGGSSGGAYGGSRGVSISGDEAYRGQLAAAVSPVQFAGASQTDRNWLQKEIVRGIGEANTFATVIPLSARGESNEAEVLIDPAIVGVERWSGGLNRVDLRLRAYRKTGGAVGLDKVYTGKRSGSRSAIRDAVAAATRDLGRSYGTRPVY